MAAWSLTPALAALRDTFNRIAPGRDKSSDGSIGDAAHASSPSSHNPDETGRPEQYDADTVNEVHAIDVDETGPWPVDSRGQFTLMRAVRQLVTDHRAGREDRLTYIIYERTIWAASWGWAARAYTGANPHDKHAHFNGSYETARERDASRWNIGFEEADVPLTDAEIKRVAEETATVMLSRQFREYADEDGDGVRDFRTVSDLLWATHRGVINMVTASAARDAAEQARDAAQTELIRNLAAAAGQPLTDQQLALLLEEMRSAAAVAGAQATQRLEDLLRAQHHAVADAARAEADRLAAG